MPHPRKGEPGYEEYREAYNARRRKRRENPEYVAKQNERWADQEKRRKANRTPEQRAEYRARVAGYQRAYRARRKAAANDE